MTYTRRTSTLTSVAMACLLGVALVGCSASTVEVEDSATPPPPMAADAPDEADGAGPSDDATDADPVAKTEPEPRPEKSQTPDDTTPQAGSGAACIHGTWLADNDFFLEAIRQFGDEIKDVTGRVVVDYAADGSFSTDYQEWRISAEAEGIGVTIVRDGIDTGEYTATDTTITLMDTEMGSMLLLTTAGMEMPVEPEPASYREVSYTCDQTSLSIVTPDGAMEMTRQ